jgi:outer membrane protein W
MSVGQCGAGRTIGQPKKIWMRTSASADGVALGSLKIDPLVVGVGVGMRF